jgi:hypothetical protein
MLKQLRHVVLKVTLADPRLVLGGGSAARLLNWQLPEGSWPAEAYVPERQLTELIERYALEREEQQPVPVDLGCHQHGRD